jgi:hypothetical protein
MPVSDYFTPGNLVGVDDPLMRTPGSFKFSQGDPSFPVDNIQQQPFTSRTAKPIFEGVLSNKLNSIYNQGWWKQDSEGNYIGASDALQPAQLSQTGKNVVNALTGLAPLQLQDDSGTVSLDPRTGSLEALPKDPNAWSATLNPIGQSGSITKGPITLSGGLNNAPANYMPGAPFKPSGPWGMLSFSSAPKGFTGSGPTPPEASVEQALNYLQPRASSYSPAFDTRAQNFNQNYTPQQGGQFSPAVNESMWYAPKTTAPDFQYDPNAMKPEVKELLDKTVQKVQAGGSSTGYDMDSLASYFSNK